MNTPILDDVISAIDGAERLAYRKTGEPRRPFALCIERAKRFDLKTELAGCSAIYVDAPADLALTAIEIKGVRIGTVDSLPKSGKPLR